jgi:hypothetical protein
MNCPSFAAASSVCRRRRSLASPALLAALIVASAACGGATTTEGDRSDSSSDGSSGASSSASGPTASHPRSSTSPTTSGSRGRPVPSGSDAPPSTSSSPGTTSTPSSTSEPADGGGTAALACAGRKLVTLWSGTTPEISADFNLGVDATSVYWVVTGPMSSSGNATESVLKVPIGGGAVSTITSARQVVGGGQLATFGVDGTNVYWSGFADVLLAAPIAGGDAVTLLPYMDQSIDSLGGFAVDSGDVLALAWNQNGPSTLPQLQTQILSIEGAAAPKDLANVTYTSSEVGGVGFDADNVYVAGIIPGPPIPACGGACEYETTEVNVVAIPRAGGSPRSLTTTPATQVRTVGTSVAVDASNVYFVSAGEVTSVPIAGGGTKTLASSPAVSGSFAYDGASIYWGSNHGSKSTIASVGTGGGEVSILCTGHDSSVVACAVDATSLYCLVGSSSGTGAASLVAISK